jgi:gluconate 5-dehydrogenase
MFSLTGKVGLVTGAARGIGRALALALGRAGAAVVLLGRDAASLQAAGAELEAENCAVTHVVADVGDLAAIAAAVDAAQQWRGRLDLLINNAGIEEPCASLSVSEALWDRIVDTNLKGAFFCAQAAARHMHRGSSIVNVCSLTSAVGVPGAAAYGASKSGLAGLTRTLAAEWASTGIRVNGIGPGYFRTALTESFYRDEDWQRAMLAKIPMGRFGRLEDLAGATVFLCSDASAYMTGQILYVDGGYLAAI